MFDQLVQSAEITTIDGVTLIEYNGELHESGALKSTVLKEHTITKQVC